MNPTTQIKMFLSMFEMQLPTLIVCVVACLVILTRWRPGSRSSLFALLGFGLALILCFLVPLVQIFAQGFVFQSSGGLVQTRIWVLSAIAFFWAVLHATVYVLLLLAVLPGRAPSASTAANPP